MAIKKSGFLYVYTSNESPQDVFFDDVVVAKADGPLLEETHYYPFGLTMAGISSSALKGSNYAENRKKYNGNELQSGEFNDGSGLEWFDFNARTYDAQIGRFLQIDPEIENNQEGLTPYHFAFNNPIKFSDPNGRLPIVIPIIIYGMELAIEGYEAYRLYRAINTVVTVTTLLSESAGKNGTPARGKETAPAAKDETGTPLKAPEKAIDEKAKPKISPEVADKLEKMESVIGPEGSKPSGGSSKNEKHGDGGRAKSKAEKQIEQYKEQLKTATGREKKQIEQKIKNVQRDAAQKAKGEEHSRANKR